MKIPICQRVFQYFCHFFIFSGTYRKQCGANAVFCAFCAVWGGIFIPPEYRLSAPAPKIGCPVSATTANRASSIADRQNRKHALYPVSAHIRFTPACPVSATPTAFASRIGQFPPLYAGVQAMRARICSAFSCDMFARVVV